MPNTSHQGARISYRVSGSGPTALFLSGIGQRAVDWNDRFLATMGERFRVVAPDNRGTGHSDAPEGEYTLDLLADDAVAVLDALDCARAHVIGHSMGGMIAQLVAARHPHRVERLVLVCTHAGGPTVVPPTPQAMAALIPARTLPPAEIVRYAMTTISSPGFAARDPAAIAQLVANAEATPTPQMTWVRQMQAILVSDRTGLLPKITVPTLVIHGADDSLIPPANGRAIATLIPGAGYAEIVECGHMPMWERPLQLAQIVGDFLLAAAHR